MSICMELEQFTSAVNRKFEFSRPDPSTLTFWELDKIKICLPKKLEIKVCAKG